MKIRSAKATEHGEILRIAKTSKFTRDYSNTQMFSGEAAYDKGWIRVAVVNKKVVGYTCVRHKVRQPETSLYFIGVSKDAMRMGVASALLVDLMEQSPHRRIVLNVMNDNTEALAFYDKHGFTVEGEALKGQGVKLSKEW